MICYETERLQVRHLTKDDLDGLAALCADPLGMRYVGDGEVLSRETCAHWIDICQEKYATRGYGTSGIFDKATGAFMGICGVVRPSHNDFDEIIYALSQDYWGKGYATEAARAMLDYVFRISELDMIYATIHDANTPSQHIMTKLNMRHVEDWDNEDSHTTRVYAMTRAEWSAAAVVE